MRARHSATREGGPTPRQPANRSLRRFPAALAIPMHYVYLLESAATPREHYVGRTADLRTRLADHNAGKSPHTAKHRPWNLVCYHASPTPAAPPPSKPI